MYEKKILFNIDCCIKVTMKVIGGKSEILRAIYRIINLSLRLRAVVAISLN